MPFPCKVVMPRRRRYVSTIVPKIGCDIAKSRLADSGDPASAEDDGRAWSGAGVRSRQAEKAPCFIGDVREIGEAAAFADDVEQIAMLAGRRVRPLASGSPAGFWPVQPYEEGASRRVVDVANQPVAALPPAVGEVAAAHRLGIAPRDGVARSAA